MLYGPTRRVSNSSNGGLTITNNSEGVIITSYLAWFSDYCFFDYLSCLMNSYQFSGMYSLLTR